MLDETKKAEQSAIETFQEKAAILEVYEKVYYKNSRLIWPAPYLNAFVTSFAT